MSAETMKIKTWDTHNINDITSYIARVTTGDEPSAGTVEVIRQNALQSYPVATGFGKKGIVMPVTVRIMNQASVDSKYLELLGWFPDDGVARTLVATDGAGVDYYRTAICGKVERIGKYALRFHLEVEDPQWVAVTITTETIACDDSTSTAITVGGNRSVTPTYTIKPTGAKTGGYNYSSFQTIYNRTTSPITNYPYDFTADAWNTAALVAQAAIHVTIDMVGNWGAGVATVVYDGETGTMPSSGMAYCGTEQFSYTGKTATQLTGCTRGINGTTDAIHLDNAIIYPSKVQADGDDCRLFIDGAEWPRWFDGFNTSTTKVWSYINLSAKQEFTTNGAMTDAQTTMVVNESIAAMPANGILLCETELMTYTARDTVTKTFSGLTRGAKGTTAATHATTSTARWIEHDIWIYYGQQTATAPSYATTYKPMFELDHSTNASWVYEKFYDDGYTTRPGSWYMTATVGSATYYGGNQGATATGEWGEIGIKCTGVAGSETHGIWALNAQISNIITEVNYTNGEKYITTLLSNYSGWLDNPTVSYYTIPDPVALITWTAWNNDTSSMTNTIVRMGSVLVRTADVSYTEAADCTVTLSSTLSPLGAIGAEQGTAYALSCTITNGTESLVIAYNMKINQTLSINTSTHVVTLVDDNANAINAITIPIRKDWLKLTAGANTIVYTETGATAVTLTITYYARQQ